MHQRQCSDAVSGSMRCSVSWSLLGYCRTVWKITSKSLEIAKWPWKSLRVIENKSITVYLAIRHCMLVVSSNNVTVCTVTETLQYYITPDIVCLWRCEILQLLCLSYKYASGSCLNISILIHTRPCMFKVWDLQRYQTAELTFKVTYGHCLTELKKLFLNRGSRSDRPRYCVTTPIRARHWPLTLAYDLDFQSQVSYGHDHTHTRT